MTEQADIQVPIIEITEGWTVDDVTTEDDCDDAFAVLTALCVSIEARMDDLAMQGLELSLDHKKAKAALRWKKAALSVVSSKRGQIRRMRHEAKEASETERILAYLKAMHPEEVKAAERHVAARTDTIILDGRA